MDKFEIHFKQTANACGNTVTLIEYSAVEQWYEMH